MVQGLGVRQQALSQLKKAFKLHGPRQKMMSPKDKLFKVLRSPEAIITPGGWNALSVRMTEAMGFRLSFITGGGITETLLGRPDLGTITMSEVVSQVNYMCQVTELPIIVDGDSGFGNAMNAMRTVTEMEAAGAAGICIEDRITPPYHYRSPSIDSAGAPELYPADVATKKIAACVRGIRKGEISVVGRSDSGNIEESITRGKAYVKAGAELFFPHGTPRSFSPMEVRHIAESVGVPTLVNLPLLRDEKKGKRPTASDFDHSLAKIVLFPREIVNAGIAASVRALQEIQKTGMTPEVPNYTSDPKLGDLVGYAKFFQLSKEYLPALERI
jgi:2,3-dimethylmalate lyase